jgi:hydrogenase maturation protease
MNVLILGLGNLLLSDEGVGVHAVNALSRRFEMPEGVETLDGGTSGMDLLDAIAGRDHLIVCDAIRSDERPGSVQRIDGESIAAFFATRISPHQLGLSEVLANLELLGERPGHVTIIGVVPADLSLGTELSAAGREGMAKSIDFILDDLAAIGVRLTSEPLAATGTD